MHFEIVTATATAPGAGGAAASAVTGDSLTVKNGKGKVRSLMSWTTLQGTAGFAQLTTPSGHDTTRGYRVGNPANVTDLWMPPGIGYRLVPQELMSVLIAGSAVAGDVEQWSTLLHYEDLPGVTGRAMKWGELKAKADVMMSVEASITSAAGPGYSGEESIDTDSNLMRANRDYALIGISTRTRVHAITLRGPDTGNVRIGCPGILRPELTNQWFAGLARAYDEPLIPIINSGNRNSTLIGVATDENAGTFVITLHFVLLKTSQNL